jgi:hypothetical protein
MITPDKWQKKRGHHLMAPQSVGIAALSVQVFMMFLPTLRALTGPFPPRAFAARPLAAVILPPLLFFAI